MSLAQLTTKFFQPLRKKRGLAYSFGIVSAITGAATYHFRNNADIEEKRFNEAVAKLQADFSPEEISGFGNQVQPW